MGNMPAFLGVLGMSSVWKEFGFLSTVSVQGNMDLNGAENTAALELDFFNIQEEINLVCAFPRHSGQPGWEFL